MVRIDNKVFYVFGLGPVLKVIVAALGLTNTMIKRLDLCYDTDIDALSLFKALYYDPFTKFRLRNKINVNGTGPEDELVIIGSLKSRQKCIAIYNKTKEINSSHKEYIRNLHKKLFGLKSIYRVELRLMNKIMNTSNIVLLDLENSNYLETIFNTYFDTLVHFSFLKTNEKIDFITLNNTGKIIQGTKKKRFNAEANKLSQLLTFWTKSVKHLGLVVLGKVGICFVRLCLKSMN